MAWSHLMTGRQRARLAVLVMLGPSRLAAQESDGRVPTSMPGVYAAARCTRAAFPAELPLLDSVLDSAGLAANLRSAAVNKRVVFALRLGALETVPRVRVLEKKVSASVADNAVSAVEAAFREIPPDRAWAFRLRVEGDGKMAMRLEKSEVCAGAPALPRRVRVERMTGTPEEFERMRREADETQRRLRSMRHHVLLDANGQVLAIELVSSSGDARMDESGIDRLRRAPFSPTTLDGVPVSAWIEVRGDDGLPMGRD